ncbi:HD domain-containing protein [Paenibacillus sp. P96]|uniref:HD domain-containing protein n=1 Tax=Paenibacillus zeirhizosphaerae TaxID=2987519 RepID=A0ABT9FLD8_9BACL|nr:HD domain-containing protein [Paenibacillus sp. P96]MDP4095405.1 HD domain-containing protein [Paenibacillus sp. P96]
MNRAEQFVKEQLQHDSSGHDWWHAYRVKQTAAAIAEREGADSQVCILAALLHDVADPKLNPSKEEGLRKVEGWLQAEAVSAEASEHILGIISTMSYSGGNRPPMQTLEGRIVQDADRLDAIGAIGIGRAFAYGGARGRLMYDPGESAREFQSEAEYRNHRGTTIHHFDEKLLKLKELMNTESGRELAEQRHQFMLEFLDRFHKEWEGN